MQDANVLSYLIRVLGADEGVAAFQKVSAAGKQAMTEMNRLATASAAGSKAQYQLAQSVGSVASATDRASKSQKNYFGHITRTTIQSALINKLFLEMVDVSGQAIQQVDAFNNFPATMASMGQSTQEASEAFQALRDYVGQIGGNLGDATSYVTRFTGATRDVKSAVAIYTGLNNALIAGDSSLEEQRQAVIQFAQALERGRPDIREWRNLTQNMSFQLQQVAKEMGYVNANALGEALTTGEESMASFTTELTKLATGTGPIAQQAIARMNGMQFAFNVLKNTMVQGLAAIINAFGRQNIVSFFRFLTQVVQVLTGWVVKLVHAFIWLLNILGGLFGLPPIIIEADGVAEAASGAGDIADGLGDANKEAKKLNKSLASFDQMNVLPDKTSGKGDDAGAGGAPFSSGEIDTLNDLFNGIDKGLQEASKWAKIFAGILAGIAALKFAGPILRQIKALTDGFKGGQIAVKNLGDAIKNSTSTSSKEAFKNGKTAGEDFKNGMATAFRGLPGLIGGILGGLAAVVKGAVLAGAATLSASTGVFVAIVAAIVVAIVAVIYTLVTYWDEIVAGMKAAWEGFTGVLAYLFEGPIKEIQKAWDKFYEAIRPGIEKIQELFEKLGEKLAPVFKRIREAIQPVINKVKELYEQHIQPLVDKFKELTASSNVIISVLKGIGLVIGGIVLVAVGLLLAAIAGIVIAVAALAAGIVWVIAKIIEFGAYIIGGGLWEDIQGLISATAQWFSDKFNEALEFVKGIFAAIGQWFKDRWNEVVAVFAGVGTWFRDRFKEAWEGVKLIWSVLGDWFKERWENLKHNLATVGTWFKEKFLEAWNGIVAIWNGVGKWFGDRWTDIKNIFNGIKTWFSDKFKEGWEGIKSVFSGVKEWFKSNVVDKIVNAFTGIKDRITGFFRGVWDGVSNGLKDALNNILNLPLKIPSVTVAGKTIGGQTLIPRLARGGIVDQPTTAIIGEEGREAIVPLENNLEWIDKIAAKINAGSGNSGQPVELTVQIGEEQIARKVIELINEKTNMSGRNVIYV